MRTLLERMEKAFETFEDYPVLGGIVRFFRKNTGILLAFLLLFVVLSLTTESFFTTSNALNVLRTVSTNAFLAMGVMLALSLGGIDLTGGALVALSGTLAAVFIAHMGMNIYLAMLLGLVSGTIAGLLNGLIIAYSGIHPFIVTLAMQSICRGAAYLVTNGSPVQLYGNAEFSYLGNGLWHGIPLPVLYMLFFFIVLSFLINKTRFGRHIYAVGGNPVAARFSGIRIKKIKIVCWTISGFLASFSGLVLAARMTSGQPSIGLNYETDAIAACVIGGTSMYGGSGSVGGMILGVLIVGIISNGLNLMRVNSYWQYVVKGLIILGSVYIDIVRKRKEAREDK